MATECGVIENATGDLLRSGFATKASWEADGAFDLENETVREDVPFPGKRRGDPDESQMHRWSGSEWTLVAQP